MDEIQIGGWGMGDIERILDKVEKTSERAALVTLIDVQGSFYRKPGAAMLLFHHHQRIGLISGGCLEMDIESRVQDWFELSTSDFENLNGQILTYDLRSENDSGWGRGPGCNGVITILVEPVTETFRHQLKRLKHQLDQGHSGVSLRQLEKNQCVKRAFLFENGLEMGDVWAFRHVFSRIDYETVMHAPLPENMIRLPHAVSPRLVIIGAADDAKPLSALAARTGWRVTVADFRAALCHKGRFPEADFCIVAEPGAIAERLQLREQDAVVVMTHDFQADQKILHGLIGKHRGYIGLLGPRERTNRLLKGQPWPQNLHAPVGLAIGAEGPEEIAISVMAEIIKVFRWAKKTVGAAHG